MKSYTVDDLKETQRPFFDYLIKFFTDIELMRNTEKMTKKQREEWREEAFSQAIACYGTMAIYLEFLEKNDQ